MEQSEIIDLQPYMSRLHVDPILGKFNRKFRLRTLNEMLDNICIYYSYRDSVCELDRDPYEIAMDVLSTRITSLIDVSKDQLEQTKETLSTIQTSFMEQVSSLFNVPVEERLFYTAYGDHCRLFVPAIEQTTHAAAMKDFQEWLIEKAKEEGNEPDKKLIDQINLYLGQSVWQK